MAGDWIKFEIATLDKPEVLQLAEMLETSPDDVIGKLLRVWAWFDRNSIDGYAGGVTNVTLMLFIDRLVSRNGFAACMKKVGWLTDNGLPNFDRHNGETAKKRALSKNRMKRMRDAVVALGASPEKRREEKSKNETTPAVPIRESGAVDNFAGVAPPDGVETPKPGNLGSLGAAALESLRTSFAAGSDQHEAAGALWAVLKANRCKGTSSHPQIIEWVRDGVTVDLVRAAIMEARKTNDGELHPNYLAPIVDRLKSGKGRANGKGQAWATDEKACEERARELGLWPARAGESFDGLRNRIRDALSNRAREAVR